MAIQHYHSQSCSKLSKNPAMNYNDQLAVITLHTVGGGRRAGGLPDPCDPGILPSSRPEGVEVLGT